MEEITLPFNISSKRYEYEEAAEIRREISKRLDKVLKDTGAGNGSGATSNLDSMEIFIKATNPDKAIEIIKADPANHWVFPLMEIRRRTIDLTP